MSGPRFHTRARVYSIHSTMAAARRRQGDSSSPKSKVTEDDGKTSQIPRQKFRGRRKKALWSMVSGQTWQASAILALAMVTAITYNRMHHSAADPFVGAFIDAMCAATDVECHADLRPSRRTQRASTTILPGATVLRMPRSHQILDIDALRAMDAEMLSARLLRRGAAAEQPLSSAAFLAAHLARLQKLGNATNLDPLLQHYLSILPSFTDYGAFHPILWSETDLINRLRSTLTLDYVMAFRELFDSEYQGLTEASSEFGQQITREQYLVARLAVLTRAFGTGPDPALVTRRDIERFHDLAGVDLSKGCFAMVPILDLYDHHAKPNVGFRFEEGAFVIQAVDRITAGTEVFDSYGKRTDSDLFARYGFVNGDGSDYTSASIALWHKLNLLDDASVGAAEPSRQLRAQVLRYLQYDDGYGACVSEDDTAAWDLKLWKYRFLLARATMPKFWVATMAPRAVAAKPAASSDKLMQLDPPAFDLRNLQFNGTSIFSTCRVLVVTHTDYGGQATSMLRENWNDLEYILPPTNDALEFRTLLCMARMASTALDRIGAGAAEQKERTADINKRRSSPHDREWLVEHVKLGELQSLEALRHVAFTKLRASFDQQLVGSTPAYQMRDAPCPKDSLLPLLTGQV